MKPLMVNKGGWFSLVPSGTLESQTPFINHLCLHYKCKIKQWHLQLLEVIIFQYQLHDVMWLLGPDWTALQNYVIWYHTNDSFSSNFQSDGIIRCLSVWRFHNGKTKYFILNWGIILSILSYIFNISKILEATMSQEHIYKCNWTDICWKTSPVLCDPGLTYMFEIGKRSR